MPNANVRIKLMKLHITQKKHSDLSWTWWRTPVVPALGRLRQRNHCEFKAVWAT